MRSRGVELAIAAAGSQVRLAQALGLSQQAISQWVHVPVKHLIKIEKIFGVPREQLRPELYYEMTKRRRSA